MYCMYVFYLFDGSCFLLKASLMTVACQSVSGFRIINHDANQLVDWQRLRPKLIWCQSETELQVTEEMRGDLSRSSLVSGVFEVFLLFCPAHSRNTSQYNATQSTSSNRLNIITSWRRIYCRTVRLDWRSFSSVFLINRTLQPLGGANRTEHSQSDSFIFVCCVTLSQKIKDESSSSCCFSSSLSPGSCQLIVEPQCHMLPYNQTWLSSSVAVVKSSEVDMLLR